MNTLQGWLLASRVVWVYLSLFGLRRSCLPIYMPGLHSVFAFVNLTCFRVHPTIVSSTYSFIHLQQHRTSTLSILSYQKTSCRSIRGHRATDMNTLSLTIIISRSLHPPHLITIHVVLPLRQQQAPTHGKIYEQIRLQRSELPLQLWKPEEQVRLVQKTASS